MVEQCVNHFIVISINIILLSTCSSRLSALRTHLLIIRFVYLLLFSLFQFPSLVNRSRCGQTMLDRQKSNK